MIGSGAAQAASYLDIYGTVHNPIQDIDGGNLAYSGNNLEPNANLYNADLYNADLNYANLANANLTYATLDYADLNYADLTDANLTYANLIYANLVYADLTDADLTDANLYKASLFDADLTDAWLYSANLDRAYYWADATWTGAKYSLNAVDNNSNPIADTIFPDGMAQAWRDAAGMVAVPEPTTALLLGIGLVRLAARRTA